MAKRHAGLLGAALGTTLLVFAPRAAADVELELGFRSGYGLPFGKFYDRQGTRAGADIEGSAAGQIPLWLDVGARLGGRLFVGAYVQYGIVIFSDDMSSVCAGLDDAAVNLGGGADCALSDTRIGLNAHYHFGETRSLFDPWLGLGVGYEWISQSITLDALGLESDVDTSLHGFELLNLQAGLDFLVTDGFGFGPFVAFTFASYGSVSVKCDGDCPPDTERSASVDDGALHHWLFLGIRGTFVF